MKRVRVSLTLTEEARVRLANEARAKPESLDSYLGRLVMNAADMPDPDLVEELRRSRAEASARARELGEARRQIRNLRARLNSLHAGGDERGASPAPWSLDQGRSSEEAERWWRWLEAGVERLRQRYQVVQLGYTEVGQDLTWWWESLARVRAIAIAIAWDEALDQGGASVPADPRYGEAFLEYLWRLASRDLTLVEVGRYFGPGEDDGDHPLKERREQEKRAFAVHISRVVQVPPGAAAPSSPRRQE